MIDIPALTKRQVLLFDGAMGTILQQRGLELGQLPELLNLSAPAEISAIHAEYVRAGADIVTTNSFQANEFKLAGKGDVAEVVAAAVACARAARPDYVALDIGPLGQLLEPMGSLSFERAYAAFQIQMVAGEQAGADLVLIETIADPYEAKAAILAAKESTSLPIICTLTFEADGRTFVGCDPRTAVISLQELGIAAFGVNCSLRPKELQPIVAQMLEYCQLPLVVQANAGLPSLQDGKVAVFASGPAEYAQEVLAMVEQGVSIIGGCCGTTPEYIRLLKKGIDGLTSARTQPQRISACSSGTRSVVLDDGVTVIGERLNPTGKKRMQQALRDGDIAYMLDEALAQQRAQAQILDVNVGIPDIDEPVLLPQLVKELQAVVSTPLQLDSADPAAIESAIRVYNGKALINSVNGKEEVMRAIFPLAKHYGALVLGLTLDADGIPPSAEGRLRIAERIVTIAAEYGIPKENLLIDCLTLTASAQQEQATETLGAVRLVREQLGVKTVLGVSNISFGLPEREAINATFLAVALGAGLNAAILNPLSPRYQETLAIFRLLNNEDKGARQYLKRHSQGGFWQASASPAASSQATVARAASRVSGAANKTASAEARDAPAQNADTASGARPDLQPLSQAIKQGQRELAGRLTSELLQDTPPLEIINSQFIPALNRVGELYESGEIFLPQLLQAAQAAQSGFAAISEAAGKSGAPLKQRGTILLATVQGDIHDIGKNIVAMLLENYGYNVIDLGKDVPPERIIEIVRQDKVRLVGLSALMTTTVKSMGATIQMAREAGLDCAFMVGGAVLNERYAAQVGADFYARDALESVAIANRFFADVES